MKRMFYHGTTDLFPIKNVLLPPEITENLREDWRSKDRDKVFFTSSLASATMYAKKASEKYGGKPIVYEVLPIGRYYNTSNIEYIANKARVVKRRAI